MSTTVIVIEVKDSFSFFLVLVSFVYFSVAVRPDSAWQNVLAQCGKKQKVIKHFTLIDFCHCPFFILAS